MRMKKCKVEVFFERIEKNLKNCEDAFQMRNFIFFNSRHDECLPLVYKIPPSLRKE